MRALITKLLPAAYVATILVACGGDDLVLSDEDALIGSWLLTTESGCGKGFIFRVDNTYVYTQLCELDSRTLGAQNITGHYIVHGDRVQLNATAATCEGVGKEPEWAAFRLGQDQDQLTLTFDSFGYVMNRSTEGSGGGTNGLTVVLGCFAADGRFMQRAVTPL